MRILTSAIAGLLMAVAITPTQASETLRLGLCSPVLDIAVAAPIAAAKEFGWLEEGGIDLQITMMSGSTECVLAASTGEIDVANAAPEALAILASRGGKVKVYYTTINKNMFGLAVPADSGVEKYEDLRGKRIGVSSMNSVGVVIARSVIQSAGLNPDTDVTIVVSGSPAQSRLLLEQEEIAALSQWESVYESIGAAGLPMRKLSDPNIDSFPSNGFVANLPVIESKGEQLAALAKAYAMGTVFTSAHPEEAAQLFFKQFPEARSTGLSLEEDIQRSLPALNAIIRLWQRPEGSANWGNSDPAIYQSYIDWLKTRGVLEGEVTGEVLVDNSLIPAINDFDEAAVEALK